MCRHEIVEREKMSTMVVKLEMKTREPGKTVWGVKTDYVRKRGEGEAKSVSSFSKNVSGNIKESFCLTLPHSDALIFLHPLILASIFFSLVVETKVYFKLIFFSLNFSSYSFLPSATLYICSCLPVTERGVQALMLSWCALH